MGHKITHLVNVVRSQTSEVKRKKEAGYPPLHVSHTNKIIGWALQDTAEARFYANIMYSWGLPHEVVESFANEAKLCTGH